MLSDKIEQWLEEQMDNGKTRDDLHNTHFVYKDSVGVIRKSGRNGFDLQVWLDPKVVFFD